MWRIVRRFPWIVFGLTCVLVLGGCGGSGLKVHAAPKLLESNPMTNVAVIGEGRVVYPRQAGREPLLCLTKSKESLSVLLAQTKAALEQKGYSVVFCEPVGVGYCDPGLVENWVYEDYEHSETKWQARAKEPAYEYPVVEGNPAFRQACRNLFEGINAAVRARTLASYTPSPDDIAVLQTVTKADTIILERTYGQEFTAQRKFGGFMLGIAAGALGAYADTIPEEYVESFLVCIEGASGEVLWQHALYINNKPCKPVPSFMDEVLNPFPKRNEPMDPKYVAR